MRIRVLLLITVTLGAAAAAPGGRLHELPLLNAGYPRAFFFRASEGLARAGRAPYAEWEKTFLRLNGIMGKVLDEEVPGTQAPNVPVFTRFKAAHPEQAVLLHFNGNARDPRWENASFFAGHWLYYPGCRLAADLPAQPGEATLAVADPTLFRTGIGRYQDANEDIGICALGPDGKPDWSQAEQVELLAIDSGAGTLRVRRGAYGTAPRAFTAGKAYVGAHAHEGPWGKRSHLLWLYNYSTACPRDAQGRTCAEVLVEDLARRFLPGGALASFDGLEFDVLNFVPHSGGGRVVDADADGKPDGGVLGGVNSYGVGVFEFCRKLRERLGEDRLILADGHSPAAQRAFGVLNGIESEGWPDLTDPEVVDWSGGLNRHEFWRLNGRAPAFSYINHKFVQRGAGPGEERARQVPASISRLVFAAGLFTDSAITYALQPPSKAGEPIGIYDELRMGTAGRLNWLGQPLGPPVRLGLRAPDLLAGRGRQWTPAFAQGFQAESARLTVVDGGRALRAAAPPGEGTIRFVLPDVKVPAGDLLIRVRLQAEPMKGYPSEVARLCWVGWQATGDLMRPEPLATGMALRGKAEEAIRPETGALARYVSQATVAGETHRAYFVHPPYRGGTGETFWEAAATVPKEAPRLTFSTALNDRARATSDGVGMRVLVRAPSGWEEAAAFVHTERRWVARRVDLSRWAGRSVRLRFVTDAGPAGNPTADQTYWGDVRLEGPGASAPDPARLALTPARAMTWANGRPFEACFYFRDLGPGTVDLTFNFEGAEPVTLSELTLHSSVDAIAREYEHGVVLANPSAHPSPFDLAALFPGRKLRRIQGSPEQDPAANNGQPAAGVVEVGPRDALFLTAP